MNVKQLISRLKKMPQNLEVGMQMHDNNEDEVAAWVFSVNEIIEDIREYNGSEKVCGDKCIVLGA